MNIFNFLSLRGRFLVAPFIGVALTLILYFTSNGIIQSQSDVFQDLSDSNLPQISKIGKVTVLLAKNHNELSVLLNSAAGNPDEEYIYSQGRIILNQLHDLEGVLSSSLGEIEVKINRVNVLGEIKRAFASYRETTISAIELSTVDPNLSQEELASANKVVQELNNLFLVLTEYYVNKLTKQSVQVEETLYNQELASFSAALLLAAMIVSAFYFSGRLSSGLEKVNKAIIKLSDGESNIDLPDLDDKYLQELIAATHEFQRTLISNERHKEKLNNSIEQLKDSEQRYFSLLNLVSTAIVIIDDKQKIILFNKAAETVFGYSSKEVLHKSLSMLLPVTERQQHDEYVTKFCLSDVDVNINMSRQPLTTMRKNGEEIFIEAKLGKLELANETLMTAAITNVTERLKSEEKILHQAHFDSLTDLPNRFLSLDRLSNLIIDAKRKSEMLAVLFIDLDEFKKVNDTMGHETGDKLLIEAADRLLKVVRIGDTVGRLGGDEFIVLLSGLANATDALAVVDNLILKFRDAFEIGGRELILTASIGISIFPDDGENASELLRNSDSAMYHAKELGRNTYSYYTEAMNKGMSRRLALEEQMNGALEREEFHLLYQPQIDIKNNNVIGCEALLRWTNPVLGEVDPDEFIPISEQTGLIISLGQFVLEQSLEMVAKWKLELDLDMHMSVNLSPVQFRDSNLVGFIEKTLDRYNIKSDCLEFEITEGVLMSGHSYIDEALKSMHNLGVGIALDDFGTGYSSLSYLRNYPFSTLKIDRSFVKDITVNQDDLELVNATIAMAHALGLKVVAEGVETQEQLNHLAKQHCEIAQGYFFSKPVSHQEVVTIVTSGII